jgi:hypothetical protein
VTLRIPVDVTLFAEGASLQVRVWNREQLAAAERNRRCGTVYDPATGEQEIRCPEGITFQPVKPEEFEFPVHEIAGRVAVKSATLRVGERFRILLSGKSRDGCNTTSADLVGSVEAADVVVGSPSWSTTARACAGG